MSRRMRGLLWLLAGTFILALVAGCAVPIPGTSPAAAPGYANAHLIVEAEWLHQNKDARDLRIIDVRKQSDYQAGHVPGAVWANYDVVTNDPKAPVAGMLIGPELFEDLARDLGINPDTRVVIYDDETGLRAARLFYALEYYGHYDKARILNGGFAAWKKAGLPLSRDQGAVPRGTFTAAANKELMQDKDGVLRKIGDANICFLDARSTKEYTGEDVRAKRGGHIPGAVHVEWSDALADEGGVKRWRPAGELIAMYTAAGVRRDQLVIPYCQTNVRGAHTYFTLRLLGYKVSPYEGSWAEWGNLPDVPAETGKKSS